MRLDIEPHLARILAMDLSLSLMDIPVSFRPAAISLSLQLPSLLTSLSAHDITENKAFIGSSLGFSKCSLTMEPEKVVFKLTCHGVASVPLVNVLLQRILLLFLNLRAWNED